MGNINLHLEPTVDREAFDRVKSALPRISKDEQLTITMEATDAHQADNILGLLDTSGFTYQSRGSHDGNTYHIIATRHQ
ncbi:MAG: hypothetical protein FH756_19690 [Firmicutes bacterium]|nr:hypothetical protein [Bacillota bacterium]